MSRGERTSSVNKQGSARQTPAAQAQASAAQVKQAVLHVKAQAALHAKALAQVRDAGTQMPQEVQRAIYELALVDADAAIQVQQHCGGPGFVQGAPNQAERTAFVRIARASLHSWNLGSSSAPDLRSWDEYESFAKNRLMLQACGIAAERFDQTGGLTPGQRRIEPAQDMAELGLLVQHALEVPQAYAHESRIRNMHMSIANGQQNLRCDFRVTPDTMRAFRDAVHAYDAKKVRTRIAMDGGDYVLEIGATVATDSGPVLIVAKLDLNEDGDAGARRAAGEIIGESMGSARIIPAELAGHPYEPLSATTSGPIVATAREIFGELECSHPHGHWSPVASWTAITLSCPRCRRNRLATCSLLGIDGQPEAQSGSTHQIPRIPTQDHMRAAAIATERAHAALQGIDDSFTDEASYRALHGRAELDPAAYSLSWGDTPVVGSAPMSIRKRRIRA